MFQGIFKILKVDIPRLGNVKLHGDSVDRSKCYINKIEFNLIEQHF